MVREISQVAYGRLERSHEPTVAAERMPSTDRKTDGLEYSLCQQPILDLTQIYGVRKCMPTHISMKS